MGENVYYPTERRLKLDKVSKPALLIFVLDVMSVLHIQNTLSI